MPRSSDGVVRFALNSGLFVQRDAVSNSVAAELAALRRLGELGAPIQVTVFAEGSDVTDPAVVAGPVAKVLPDERFLSADLHVFEAGMYYDLFNAALLLSRDRPILMVEHNVTPPELVDDPLARAACERALAQRSNLAVATHVACVSEFNLELPRALGVPDERLSVLHLPPTIVPAAPPAPLRGHDGPVRLLSVGRLVRAKGTDDLLGLLDRLEERAVPVSLTLAGDPRFSDPELLGRVLERAEREPARVTVVLAPDDATLARLFEETDALVVPSLHEGYCVPVVEAYGFGRYVVAYDAANLPNVLGGLGALVPVGDVDALAEAVERFAAALRTAASGQALTLPTSAGALPAADWEAAVGRHLAGYSAEHYERRFVTLVRELLAGTGRGIPPAFDAAVSDLLAVPATAR